MWTIEGEIGRGGMGVVYKATHKFWTVPMRSKRSSLSLQQTLVSARFLKEAQNATKLKHPNIVETLPPFEEGEGLYLPMEFLEGKPLDVLLGDACMMGVAEALHIRAMASGLGHAHSMGIIHRDVKPANVFVTDANAIKVLDFGLAKGVDDKIMTASGLAVGTPVYIAPEVYQAQATPSADVFSLGVILFRLLSGRLPIDMPAGESSVVAVLHAVTQAHLKGLPRLSSVMPDAPGGSMD